MREASARVEGVASVDAMVARACRRIEGAERAPTLGELAAEARLSPWHFQRVFKARAGVTPKEYAAAKRAERARDALARAATVTDAIYEAGFGSSGRFYEHATDVLGMTPTAYRAGGAAETIRFSTGRCRLGLVLVASTEKGVCAILLGDDGDALARDLRGRFSRARIEPSGGGFAETVARVVAFVDAPGASLALPLDIRGTAFQRRVWRALRNIPAGATASYAEVARAVGAPGAARAVAAACAANPLAVAIPCHRVVRADGALAGYRWGLRRKRALLDGESGK